MTRRDPTPWEPGKLAIEWLHADCGRWVLRVRLSPAGWSLQGRNLRVPPKEFLRRIGAADEHGNPIPNDEGVVLTMEARAAGEIAAPDVRTVEGRRDTLPFNPAEWADRPPIEVGCVKHGWSRLSTALLVEDVERVRNTPSNKWPVKRDVVLDLTYR